MLRRARLDSLVGAIVVPSVMEILKPNYSGEVFWLPLGIGLCLLDRRIRCHRCGIALEKGICG